MEYSGTFFSLADSFSIGERLAPHDDIVIATHIKTDKVIIFFVKDMLGYFLRISYKTFSSLREL
jgi:hypothetical protein